MQNLRDRIDLAPRTQELYQRVQGDFERFRASRGGDRQGITETLCRDYLKSLWERGNGASSVALKARVLKSVYQGSAWDRMSVPRTPRLLPKPLRVEEIQAMLATCDMDTPEGVRDQAILELLWSSGARASELAGLTMRDLDWDSGEVLLMGKGGKERVAILGEFAISALRRWLVAGHLAGEDQLLFPQVDRRRVYQIVRSAGWAALRKRVSPHMLRHSFATHMLEGGAPINAISQILGHASLSSTQTYTAVSQTRLKKDYARAHPGARAPTLKESTRMPVEATEGLRRS